MRAARVRSVSAADRLRVVAGHLRAVDRLIAQGRTREAVAQLRAVRAALGAVVSQICRHHAFHCLGAAADSAESDDLLGVLRSTVTVPTRRAVRSPRAA